MQGLARFISIKTVMVVIFIAALSVSAIASLHVAKEQRDEMIMKHARQVSSRVSKEVFDALYDKMRQGWNKADINRIIEQLNAAHPDIGIAIYRGDDVARQFGRAPGEETVIRHDAEIASAMAGAGEIVSSRDGVMRFIYPVKATAECLACHTGSRVGAVHGVIEITHPVGEIETMLDDIAGAILGLCMLIGAVTFIVIYVAISFMVERPVSALSRVIDRIIEDGNLGRRVDVKVAGVTHDLRVLAQDFNTLLDSVESRQQEINKRDESLKLSAKLFENTGDGIVITNADNEILTANPAFLRLSGYRLDEIIGKNPRIFASGEHDIEFFRAMWDSIMQAGRWSGMIVDRRKDGRTYSKYLSIDAVKDEPGNITNFISIHADNTERAQAEERMHFLAYYDVLTGLPNRSLLRDRLGQFIALAQRTHSNFAVLFLDLDRFKLINDTMGHGVGDRLLQSVAKRLKAAVRDVDTVARIGGDEFVVVLQGADAEGAKTVASGIIESIRQIYVIDGQQVSSQTSIGIAIYPDDGDNIESLVKNADIAMYQAKKDGRNNYKFFSEGMDFHSANMFSMEKDLRAAILREDFHLEFQPQLSFHTGRPCGAEALIRWRHQQRGFISPAEFIPVAEETGQIIAIGEWVLREACQAAARWISEGHRLPVAVNVSARQFAHPDFVSVVSRALSESGIPAQMLEIEITEGVMMENVASVVGIMTALRSMGVLLSVDDFGTGFSSLSYIRQMPITQLKIDRTFVGDIDNGDAAITEHIITLGHKIGLEVIAEGAETGTQACALMMMGCDKMQGFHYSSPIRLDDLIRFFAEPPARNYATL